MMRIRFKINPEYSAQPLPQFCRNNCFNYFKAVSGRAEFFDLINNIKELRLHDVKYIEKLKLTNCFITDWSELWELEDDTQIIDFAVRSLDLSSNMLTRFECTERRSWLRSLNLSANTELLEINLPNATCLKALRLNNVQQLTTVNIGNNFPPSLLLVEFKHSKVYPGVISSLKFNVEEKGLIDLTNAELDLSDNDKKVLAYLEAHKWKVKKSP
ncbi:MAG: hypothetical protein ACRC80_37700 [Waterburya sp.]